MSPSARDRYSTSAGPTTGTPAGNEVSENALVARFWDRIRVFATRRLRDVSAAEDVAQETIRRVIEAVRDNRIRDLDALPAFVFQTARHLCLQHGRSDGRESRAMHELGATATETAGEPDALSRLVSAERRDAVRRAMARLDAGDRQLLTALYHGGADSADVAATLGLARGTLRVRKHRALRRLAELLGDTLE